MQPELQMWLARRVASRRRHHFAAALLGTVLGITVTFLTFWFVYALVWWLAHATDSVSRGFFGVRLAITAALRFAIAATFIALLIIDVLRRRAAPDEYPMNPYSPSFAVGGIFIALGHLLRYPQASSTMIVGLLETGPRLFLGSCSLLKETICARMDWSFCLPLIEMLAARPRAVLWEELSAAFPGFNMELTSGQLRHLGGVVFLEKGLTLSEDFRDEFGRAAIHQ